MTTDALERLGDIEHALAFYADDGSLRATHGWLAREVERQHRQGFPNSDSPGCTILFCGTPVREGFAVALSNPSVIVPRINARLIADFVATHQAFMQASNLVLGTWGNVPAGEEMILCNKIFACQDDAVRFGLSQGQRYAWDLRHGLAIALDSNNVIGVHSIMP